MTERIRMIKKVSGDVIFVLFLISAAAMDSDNVILPGMICLTSICLFYISSRMEESKKKESVRADSIKKLANCIITQGKENINGKAQSMWRKLRQWGINQWSLPGMHRRGKTEADEG